MYYTLGNNKVFDESSSTKIGEVAISCRSFVGVWLTDSSHIVYKRFWRGSSDSEYGVPSCILASREGAVELFVVGKVGVPEDLRLILENMVV